MIYRGEKTHAMVDTKVQHVGLPGHRCFPALGGASCASARQYGWLCGEKRVLLKL